MVRASDLSLAHGSHLEQVAPESARLARGLRATAPVPTGAFALDLLASGHGLPDWLRWPLWVPMQLGTLWMCVVGATVVYAATGRLRPALTTAAAVLLAWGAAKAYVHLRRRAAE